MITIYKYKLMQGGACTTLSLPANAKILRVGAQHNAPVLWAEVDSDAPAVTRKFVAIPTGGNVQPGGQYIGTVQHESIMGELVWHIYEYPY